MKKILILAQILVIISLISCSSEEMAKKNSEIGNLTKENFDLKLQAKELSNQIALKEQEIKFLKDNMDKNNQELEKAKVQVKNMENLDKDFNLLKVQDQGVQEKNKTLEKDLQDKNLTLKKADEDIKKINDDNNKIKEENNRLKTEIENLKKEALKLKENTEEKQRSAQEKQRAEQKIKEMEGQIKGFQDQLVKKDNEIKELKTLVDDLKKQREEMEKESQKIKDTFKKEIRSGEISVESSYKRIKVMMMEQVLFRKSEISLTSDGEKVLKKVAVLLKEIKDKDIFVIGHADSDPVKDPIIKKIFPTNWEFSVMRSVMVVRYLSELMGVNASMLTAAGCSSYQPILPEISEKNKSVNRRTEILIFPKLEKIKAKESGKNSKNTSKNNEEQESDEEETKIEKKK